MAKDNFSAQSKLYARYRPHYPPSLFEFLYEQVERFDKAWDCATGNGQVAGVLAQKFNTVYATDISQQQLDQAEEKQNIVYQVGSAENSGLTTKVDLITVAQAIHWFDVDAFYKEAKRLSHEETYLAYWGYGLLKISEAIDPILFDFYDHTVGPYWDPERRIIEQEYRDIAMPLKNRVLENFSFSDTWSLETLRGYLTSWSAVQHYIKKHGNNPVDEFIQEVAPLWGGQQNVDFPIFLNGGRLT